MHPSFCCNTTSTERRRVADRLQPTAMARCCSALISGADAKKFVRHSQTDEKLRAYRSGKRKAKSKKSRAGEKFGTERTVRVLGVVKSSAVFISDAFSAPNQKQRLTGRLAHFLLLRLDKWLRRRTNTFCSQRLSFFRLIFRRSARSLRRWELCKPSRYSAGYSASESEKNAVSSRDTIRARTVNS